MAQGLKMEMNCEIVMMIMGDFTFFTATIQNIQVNISVIIVDLGTITIVPQ